MKSKIKTFFKRYWGNLLPVLMGITIAILCFLFLFGLVYLVFKIPILGIPLVILICPLIKTIAELWK